MIRIKGFYPELNVNNIHYCATDHCPQDKFQILIAFSIESPNNRLGDVLSEIKIFEQDIFASKEDDEWEITIKRADKTTI